ncbi:hypothetical protein IAQ00_13725 [Pantoea ananatis]|uniref:hypothetical protein n=1 Tax=Pantoea ananas TaxID=553 RepID=UPI00207AE42A|nr:hypothetical protein [Pantoea ananatis]USL56772.1 hypothetical protein IAQ00_13725 [Pantoea ananatis]
MHKNELTLLKQSLTSDNLISSTSLVSKQLVPIIGETKADEFTKDVMEFVTTDEFITKLNDKVGDVLPGETEDEFVKRGRSILLKLLKSKFD